MSGWWNQRSRFARLLVYAVAVILAFIIAVSIGTVAALVVGGNLSWPKGERARQEDPSPAGEQRQTPQRKQTTYVHGVGEIQPNSVETFLDSHERFLHYDALTPGDIEKMQANQAALKGFADQAGDLRAPQKYEEQKDAFVSAIEELHQAAHLAYTLAAD